MPTDRTPAQDRSESYRAWDSWRSTHPSAPIGDAFLGGWAAARREGAAARDAEVRALREALERLADDVDGWERGRAEPRVGNEYTRQLSYVSARAALAAGPVPADGLDVAAELPRQFPVLWPHRPVDPRLPTSVPWALVAPHEAQAQRNHGQTLTRLAERGGLSIDELVAVLENRRWRAMSTEDALARLAAAQPAPEPWGTLDPSDPGLMAAFGDAARDGTED